MKKRRGPEDENPLLPELLVEAGVSYRKATFEGKLCHMWERGEFSVASPVEQGIIDERAIIQALEQAEMNMV
jgi:hypothetical protein